ncbi:MAG: hypothetical protein E7640_01065 [Ruminococcaceae bacterium]|nr:hypothetical protein [Oscillospiraceae bacterium]
MRRTKRTINPQIRLYGICAVFLVFCALFVCRLLYYQLFESDTYASAVIGGNVRTVVAHAARGEIRDVKGRVIVGNEYEKNMTLDYYSLPDTRSGVHRVFLSALDALEKTGTEKVESSFPLSGTFPNYTLELPDESSNIYNRYLRFIKNNFCKNGEKPEDMVKQYTAYDIAVYIAEKYEMIEFSEKGSSYDTEFTDEELDDLIRLRYDMELSGFGPSQNYTVAENVGENLVSYVMERHISGIRFEDIAKRSYKYDGYASHILGTVGPIYAEDADYYTSLGYSLDSIVGKSGCELAFEEYLRGKDGVLGIVENDRGEILYTYYVEEPVPGNDVYLTIDIDLQVAAEDALRENIEERINGDRGGKATSGAVVATDPKTGAIAAIASYPTYHLSSYNADYAELSGLEVSPYLNRALSAYAPGSTFKVGMALATLNEGLIDRSTVIETKGVYNGLACSHYHPEEGYACCGDIGVCEALEVSCNYFFSMLGDELSIEKIREYSSLFGFGEKTGIELAESNGNIAQSLAYAAAIGQAENLCTPLQISQYVAMIANGGTRYSAHLLSEVRTPSGESVKKAEVKVEQTLKGISSGDVATVLQGMYDVVSGDRASSYVYENFVRVGDEYLIGGEWQTDENGARRYVGGVTVAGKTGTAETDKSKKGLAAENAWFCGFAPFDDPKLAVTCFIEEGVTGGYASYTVAETLDAYFRAQSSDAVG